MQLHKLALALVTLESAALAAQRGNYGMSVGSLVNRQNGLEYTTSVVFVDVIPAITTSVVFATYKVTVTSCPSTVSSCPTVSASVLTSFVPVSTTICPVTLTSSYTSDVTTPWYPTISSISIPSVPTVTRPSSSTALPWISDASSSSTTYTMLPPSPTSPIAGTTWPTVSGTSLTSISFTWPPTHFSFVWPPTVVYTHSSTLTLGGSTSFVTSTSTSTLSVAYPSDSVLSSLATFSSSDAASTPHPSNAEPWLTTSPSIPSVGSTESSSDLPVSTTNSYPDGTTMLSTTATTAAPVSSRSASTGSSSHTSSSIDTSALLPFTTGGFASSTRLPHLTPPYIPSVPNASIIASSSLGTVDSSAVAPATTGISGNVSSFITTPTAPFPEFQGTGSKQVMAPLTAVIILAVVAALC